MSSDFLTLDLLPPAECEALIGELRGAVPEEAPVYGVAGAKAVVHSLTRRTTRLSALPETRASASLIFERLREPLSAHFAVPLASFEDPQFLRYTAGDYFVAHQDGNTSLILDDSRHRRVSIILFLSDPASYTGGDLVFHRGGKETAPARRGSAIAFRSEMTHEVTPVVTGERYTIVTWYR